MNPYTILIHYVSTGCNTKKWYNLKLPFALNPFNGFHDQPRTVSDAIKDKWIKVDDDSIGCKDVNGGKYAPQTSTTTIISKYHV